MSSVQKQNALTIINQLNEKNAYTSDNISDRHNTKYSFSDSLPIVTLTQSGSPHPAK